MYSKGIVRLLLFDLVVQFVYLASLRFQCFSGRFSRAFSFFCVFGLVLLDPIMMLAHMFLILKYPTFHHDRANCVALFSEVSFATSPVVHSVVFRFFN